MRRTPRYPLSESAQVLSDLHLTPEALFAIGYTTLLLGEYMHIIGSIYSYFVTEV